MALTVLSPFITGHLRKWYMSKDITYILIDITTLSQEISHLLSRIGFRIIAGLHNTGIKKNMTVLLEGVKITRVPTCWISSVCRQQFFEAPEVEKSTYSITLLHLVFLIQQYQQERSSSQCSVAYMLVWHCTNLKGKSKVLQNRHQSN